ncbi:hypothetical protein NSA19_00895 [Actinomyces bowdenii]|uniref:hypothetical protein n=1 Tax=Actinomyces bowdenii TaxID=131109 RepID=UPI00214D04ED|nr:hypothetical protein [Actinomyces bowdenii]MCR2051433.1 hypothetical protein [Actinomyces bowdenii]
MSAPIIEAKTVCSGVSTLTVNDVVIGIIERSLDASTGIPAGRWFAYTSSSRNATAPAQADRAACAFATGRTRAECLAKIKAALA